MPCCCRARRSSYEFAELCRRKAVWAHGGELLSKHDHCTYDNTLSLRLVWPQAVFWSPLNSRSPSSKPSRLELFTSGLKPSTDRKLLSFLNCEFQAQRPFNLDRRSPQPCGPFSQILPSHAQSGRLNQIEYFSFPCMRAGGLQ